MTCEDAATKCDGDSIPYCFQEFLMSPKEIQQRFNSEHNWQVKGSHLHWMLQRYNKRRRDCNDARVFIMGDSHARNKAEMLARIFGRSTIMVYASGPSFDREAISLLKLLDQKALCKGDVIYLQVFTAKKSRTWYENFMATLMPIVEKYEVQLLWSHQSWSLKEDGLRCADCTNIPTSSLVEKSAAINGHLVEKYGRHPNVTLVNDTLIRCREDFCNMMIPNSRTRGYGDDGQHILRVMSKYIEPFYCSIFKDRGLL